MRETEILRGLGKAKMKVNAFAGGVVPPEPTMGERMLGRMTGGLLGFKPPAAVTPTPVATTQKQVPTNLVQDAPSKLKAYGGGLRAMESEMKKQGLARGTAFLEGPGTGTSDSIPAHLSRGEAVLPAKTVQAVGSKNLARLITETNGAPPARGLRSGGRHATGAVPNWTTSLGADGAATNWTTSAGAGEVPRAPAPPPELLKPIASGNTAYARSQTVAGRVSGVPVAEMPPHLGAPTLASTPTPKVAPSLMDKAAQSLRNAKSSVFGAGEAATGTAEGAATRGRIARTLNPNITAGGVGGILKAGLAVVPVIGAAQAMTDTPEQVKNRFGDNGIVSNGLNFLEHTGNAASFGLAGRLGRGLGHVTQGGKFSDGWSEGDAVEAPTTPNAVTPPQAPAVQTPAQAPMTGTIGDEQQAAPAPARPTTTSLTAGQAQSAADNIRNGTTGDTVSRAGQGFITVSDGEEGGTFDDAGNQLTSTGKPKYTRGTFIDSPAEQTMQDARPMTEREQLVDKMFNSGDTRISNRAAQALANLDQNASSMYGHNVQLESNKAANKLGVMQWQQKMGVDGMEAQSKAVAALPGMSIQTKDKNGNVTGNTPDAAKIASFNYFLNTQHPEFDGETLSRMHQSEPSRAAQLLASLVPEFETYSAANSRDGTFSSPITPGATASMTTSPASMGDWVRGNPIGDTLLSVGARVTGFGPAGTTVNFRNADGTTQAMSLRSLKAGMTDPRALLAKLQAQGIAVPNNAVQEMLSGK